MRRFLANGMVAFLAWLGAGCSLLNSPTEAKPGPTDPGASGGSSNATSSGGAAPGGGTTGGASTLASGGASAGAGGDASSGGNALGGGGGQIPGGGGSGGHGGSDTCGNGAIEFENSEECDDGNKPGSDACSDDCKRTMFEIALDPAKTRDHLHPAVAPNSLDNGEGFSVVWDAGSEIRVRAYRGDGTPAPIGASESASVSDSAGAQYPAIAVSEVASQKLIAAVVWLDSGSTTIPGFLHGRFLDENGTPQGTVEKNWGTLPATAPAIASNASGAFFTSWVERDLLGGGYALWGGIGDTSSLFDSAAELDFSTGFDDPGHLSADLVPGRFLTTFNKETVLTADTVSSSLGLEKSYPIASLGTDAKEASAAIIGTSEFVIAFQEAISIGTTPGTRVLHRIFTAPDIAAGPEIPTSGSTAGPDVVEEQPRSVSWSDLGNNTFFTVVWITNDGTNYTIVGRTFMSTGAAMGSARSLYMTSDGILSSPSIAISRQGTLFVAWEMHPKNGEGAKVMGMLVPGGLRN